MDPVLLEQHAGVATLTLNRPDNANSIDLPLAARLRDHVRDLAADERVRCVVLTGHGRMFCGGGDIGSFTQAADRKSSVTELASTLHEAVEALVALPAPLVVKVNGPAAGAGFSLALLGDVVIAARSAHFTAAYTKIGMTPDGGMTWLLPRLIGMRRAQELVLTNRRLGAEEAERLGLITRVADNAHIDEDVHDVACQLAGASTSAIGRSRALLWEGQTTSLSDHLANEARCIGEAADSPDGREGVDAFLMRRTPVFGRR